jgi:uncharacterized protein DUF3141
MFSDRNPLMRHIAQLAEQVRQQRRPASSDNPFLQLQTTVSERIIAALDAWPDVCDGIVEQIFLAIYSMPALQAGVGIRPRMRARDGSPESSQSESRSSESESVRSRRRLPKAGCGRR